MFLYPNFIQLTMAQISLLESPFSIEEVKLAVWCCGGDKALVPDEFSFKVTKTKWEIVKGDIFRFIKHFERFDSITNGCSSSFITLIPKV